MTFPMPYVFPLEVVPIQSLASLQLEAHHPSNLADVAVANIERDWNQLNDRQLLAARELKEIGRYFLTADIQGVQPAMVSHIIELIGDLEFDGGLANVDFRFANSQQLGRALGQTSSRWHTGGEHIVFNISHPFWLACPRSQRWNMFFGCLLHEAVHMFLRRYTKPFLSTSRSGHGTPFHKLAEAIERVVRKELHMNVDLGRAEGMINEYQKGGSSDMTLAMLHKHFGRGGSGGTWLQPTIARDGTHKFRLMPDGSVEFDNRK